MIGKLKISAIIPAAGCGKRFKSYKNKIFADLNGKPVVVHTIETFANHNAIDIIIVSVKEQESDFLNSLVFKYKINKHIITVPGGKERQDSVYNALMCAKSHECDIVLIHDAVRPLVSSSIIDANLDTLVNTPEIDGVITAVPVKDTIKSAQNGLVKETISRDLLWSVQTPQTFYLSKVISAYSMALTDSYYATDDSALVEKYGGKIKLVMGTYKNIKLTTPEDMTVATALIKPNSTH